MYYPQQVQVAAPAAAWTQHATPYGWAPAGQMPGYTQMHPGQMPMHPGQMPGYAQYPSAAGWPQLAASQAGFYPSAPMQPAALVDPVQAFIDELGILPEEDTYFGWLAEYGLQSDVLPPQWSMHSDASTGCYYYVDAVSGSSSWQNPLIFSLQEIIEIGRHYLHAPSDDFFQIQKEALWDKHEQNLSFWHGPMQDDAGRNYFSNSQSGESSWRDPRQDTQFLYELEGSLLDALQDALPICDPAELPVFGFADMPVPRCPTPRLHSPQSPQSPASPGKTWMDTAASASVSQDEHKNIYDKMLKAADHLDYLRKDAEEAQLLLMARKVRERRKRVERLKQEKEQARRDEEARSRGFANAEEERLFILRQKSLEEQEAIRKREEAEAEAKRQKLLAEEEEAKQEEERRKELEEKRRLAEEEAAKKEAARREEERKREEARKEAEAKAEAERLAREAREKFLLDLPEVVKSRDVKAFNAALAQGEAYGFTKELDPVRQALAEELQIRKAVALKARKAAEELASQFKDAKEAQDFGGAILAAQWRAAVREVAKPFQE